MNNLIIKNENNKTLLVFVNNIEVLSIKKKGNNPFILKNKSGKLKLQNYEASVSTPIEIGVIKESALIITGETVIFNIPVHKSWKVEMMKKED